MQPDRQLALQPPGQGDQQLVARVVAERVVDPLEVVDVAADDRDALAAAAARAAGRAAARRAARLGSRVSSSTVPALRSSSAARRRSAMSVQATQPEPAVVVGVVADTASSHQTVVPSPRSSGTAPTR